MRCRYCGCTDDQACPGGCHWVAHELCSNPECVTRHDAGESPGWIPRSASEIEAAIAAGKMGAAQVFVQMRRLSGAIQSPPAAASVPVIQFNSDSVARVADCLTARGWAKVKDGEEFFMAVKAAMESAIATSPAAIQ